VTYPRNFAGRWPAGIRLLSVERRWYRLDTEPPEQWSWQPFATPRFRFDSPSGARRVRYAASSARGVLREAFDSTGRLIEGSALERRLVALDGRLRVLDLRRESVLDAFGVDDQVSTSRAPEVWQTCQQLADVACGHYGTRLHGIVYRSRTTPQSNVNLAFFAWSPLEFRDVGALRAQTALLTAAVIGDGFTVDLE
jgi:RES domain-containing protein